MGTEATRVVLDTGALIAADRGRRDVGLVITEAASAEIDVLTSSACIAEIWRRPDRQVGLVRMLRGVDEYELDSVTARAVGLLMGEAYTDDVADAALSLLVRDGDAIYTSDPGDIRHLLDVRGVTARVKTV